VCEATTVLERTTPGWLTSIRISFLRGAVIPKTKLSILASTRSHSQVDISGNPSGTFSGAVGAGPSRLFLFSREHDSFSSQSKGHAMALLLWSSASASPNDSS
jgi:hypothetical protein